MKYGRMMNLWYATAALVVVLVALAVGYYSVPGGLFALFLSAAAMLKITHLPAPWKRKIRDSNDAFTLDFCQGGGVNTARTIYRHLPSDPRCRLCLVPFGGVGRVMGMKPSRKNPNFCPS